MQARPGLPATGPSWQAMNGLHAAPTSHAPLLAFVRGRAPCCRWGARHVCTPFDSSICFVHYYGSWLYSMLVGTHMPMQLGNIRPCTRSGTQVVDMHPTSRTTRGRRMACLCLRLALRCGCSCMEAQPRLRCSFVWGKRLHLRLLSASFPPRRTAAGLRQMLLIQG